MIDAGNHVFISYRHQGLDRDYAHELQNELKRRGFEVWIDDRINYGSRWPQVIQEQLDASGAVIVIMTPRSYASDWVHNELARAKAKEKPILPLLLEGDFWLAVQATQCVDVRGGQMPPPAFFDQLAAAMSLRPAGYGGQRVGVDEKPVGQGIPVRSEGWARGREH